MRQKNEDAYNSRRTPYGKLIFFENHIRYNVLRAKDFLLVIILEANTSEEIYKII